jgi:hypothetical protein
LTAPALRAGARLEPDILPMQRGDDVGKSAFLARLLDGSAAETAEAAKHNRLQGKALPADRQTLEHRCLWRFIRAMPSERYARLRTADSDGCGGSESPAAPMRRNGSRTLYGVSDLDSAVDRLMRTV